MGSVITDRRRCEAPALVHQLRLGEALDASATDRWPERPTPLFGASGFLGSRLRSQPGPDVEPLDQVLDLVHRQPSATDVDEQGSGRVVEVVALEARPAGAAGQRRGGSGASGAGAGSVLQAWRRGFAGPAEMVAGSGASRCGDRPDLLRLAADALEGPLPTGLKTKDRKVAEARRLTVAHAFARAVDWTAFDWYWLEGGFEWERRDRSLKQVHEGPKAPPSIPAAVKREVLERDGWRCQGGRKPLLQSCKRRRGDDASGVARRNGTRSLGEDEDTARRQLVGMMLRLYETDVEVLREAAQAISSFPQPIDESADELERARPIREMLGVRSASEDLEASLRARDWLERLAHDLDSASDG
jgi:hypothetical protein